MGISGNLQTMALAELFQWIAEGDKSGTLRLDNGTVEKQLFFVDGRVIGTTSSNPKEYLGHFLVSHGYITEVELANALAMQEESKVLLGRILTSIGVLTEDDLEQMLYLKSEESIYDLFTWPDGEFKFTDGDIPEDTLQPIDLNVTRVILHGTQRLDEWARIRKHVPSPSAVPVSVQDLVSADPREAAVLGAVDDDRTVAEIALHTHSSEFHVGRILVEHVVAGRIKMVRPREISSGSEEPVTAHSGAGLLREADRRLNKLDYIGGLRCLGAARSLDPDSPEVARALKETRERIRQALANEGVQMTSMPRLSAEVEDLNSLEMSPDEGFLLSRINGRMSIDTILKISPMDPLEVQVAFLRLKTAGYVEFD